MKPRAKQLDWPRFGKAILVRRHSVIRRRRVVVRPRK
jgi:hypothetical protein